MLFHYIDHFLLFCVYINFDIWILSLISSLFLLQLQQKFDFLGMGKLEVREIHILTQILAQRQIPSILFRFQVSTGFMDQEILDFIRNKWKYRDLLGFFLFLEKLIVKMSIL